MLNLNLAGPSTSASRHSKNLVSMDAFCSAQLVESCLVSDGRVIARLTFWPTLYTMKESKN